MNRLAKIYIETGQQEKIDELLGMLKRVVGKSRDGLAEYTMGEIYSQKKFRQFDINKAKTWYSRADEKGYSMASYKLGKIHYSQENYVEAVKCFERSQSEYGYYNLGKIYMDEQSGLYDEEKAEKNFLKAEELGNVFASYQLGKLYYIQGNDTEAINHFQMCENDFANYFIGKIYLDTENEIYNPELGMHYMLLSAKEGNAYAELSIGVQYLKGEIVDRDIVEAQKWLHSSLSHGNEMAGNILRSMDEYKPNEGMASKHMGMSLASAIRRMQQGLKDEWQKRQNIREHEKLWEMNNDKE